MKTTEIIKHSIISCSENVKHKTMTDTIPALTWRGCKKP
jgi:hypothetical protein